jgi:cell division transport system permease protein
LWKGDVSDKHLALLTVKQFTNLSKVYFFSIGREECLKNINLASEMATGEEKYYKKRLGTSYITTIISITLVLFTLGFFALLMVHAKTLSEYVKENIGFEIIIKPGVKEADILHLQKRLDTEPYIKSTEYITREEAVKRLSESLGDDFVQFIGEDDNPLLPSIDVRLKASWANNDSIAQIEQQLLKNKTVKEIYYQKSLVHIINKNLNKLGIVTLVISILLLSIAIALINNTIRLSIYSKRFIIKGMQLVGATETFIMRPFIVRSIYHGIISGILSLLMLTGLIFIARRNIPELILIEDPFRLASVYAVILLTGIVISGLSTWFAVKKYLRLGSDKIYLL